MMAIVVSDPPAKHSQASLAGPGRRQRRTCPSARRSFWNGDGGDYYKDVQTSKVEDEDLDNTTE